MINKPFKRADIYLPDFSVVDPKKWAVIACDQFTSEPSYWQRVKEQVGDSPSTLSLIIPEVFLNESEVRIPKINKAMDDYLNDVLSCRENALIYIERTQSDGSVRRGVMLAVDLEAYDFNKGSTSLIRATEGTVLERIPPRVKVRRGASLELPHVLLLIDDDKKTVIEPIADNKATYETAYDFELLEDGGAIKGYYLPESEYLRIENALLKLVDETEIERRYGKKDLPALLFAVGDGNHSLATAKTAYEEIKAKLGDSALNHPARYALVEVENLHDDALQFEPIYRVMFNVEPEKVLYELNNYAQNLKGNEKEQTVEYFIGEKSGVIKFSHPEKQLTVGTLQDFLDIYVKKYGGEVDYIHGEDSTKALAKQGGAIGFIFSGMEKNQLFKTVIFDGALPRKTFSMGHARDKRYYIECRKIKPL